MYLAITGTPGTGKSTVGTLLEDAGQKVISLLRVAEENGFITGYDEEAGSDEIDIQALDKHIRDNCTSSDQAFITGHMSHQLSAVSAVIVLRCNPNTIIQRLEERGYSEDKVRENAEAEAVDVILVEALEMHDNVFEIDVTEMHPEQVRDAILEIGTGDGKIDKYGPGKVDWSEVVLGWY
jgi:adenylate kinase